MQFHFQHCDIMKNLTLALACIKVLHLTPSAYATKRSRQMDLAEGQTIER